MKSSTVISRYDLVTHSFFARNNYSALSHPHMSQSTKWQEVWPVLRQRKAATSYARPLRGRSHRSALIRLALLTTCPSLDPFLCRQAQDSKQDAIEKGRTTEKGKAGEAETTAKHIPCRNYKRGCQKGLHAGNENMGGEELHWESRHDGVHRMLITFTQRTTWYKLDGHRYHKRGWPKINCQLSLKYFRWNQNASLSPSLAHKAQAEMTKHVHSMKERGPYSNMTWG